ncbi:MAG TPA: lipoyl(octanoyl) transferase LipB [Myxococcota bacterium]|nr:lipoyl(octanoyl) transferase LipB [Myxococcota bacterium]HON25624.1 lipoyl(octanoyl) transferase LipB [Myxococcota bacterium]HPC92523.1 lipoyl(octanoyl) transferase LipB [Myxococcota bacterium]HQE74246.1 lipoyl(octanoyl) transferase LipB [Myxococcota bacterium]HQI61362.1 lipoyl(octanoyl) transferase LipB [Myxococcota bacterium]
MHIRFYGLTPYKRGLELQQQALSELEMGSDGILLALRHPPTLTLGRRTAPEEVLASPDLIKSKGIELISVNRGGGATFHYPEQAVVYPILNIQKMRLSVPDLLQKVALALQQTLEKYGVINGVWDGDRPGVYVEGQKIASVGFHLVKGMTSHGIALNIGNALDGFKLIAPCKMPDQPITSIQDLTEQLPDSDEVCNDLAVFVRSALLVNNTGVAKLPLDPKPSRG